MSPSSQKPREQAPEQGLFFLFSKAEAKHHTLSKEKELEREIGFYDYYIIDSLKIGDETLKNIRFELEEINKSKVEIILKSVVLEGRNTNHKKLQKKFRKIYRELLKKEFLNKNYNQN